MKYMQRPITTVFLVGQVTTTKKPFHCFNIDCKHVVFEYYNQYIKVFPAAISITDIPEQAHPIDRLCKFCKTVYRII